MKLPASILLFFVLVNFSFSQELEKVVTDYEQLLNEIANDTLVTRRTVRYECSEDVFGEVHFFYKEDSLRLIKHIYKQAYYQEYTRENYYLKGDSLLLQSVFTEMINLNSNYYQNSHGSYVSGAEKFLEFIEERRFINISNAEMDCYQRSFGNMASEWNEDYFNTLKFSKVQCTDNFEEVTNKFKLLLKVEKKLLNSYRKNPPCIFHIW